MYGNETQSTNIQSIIQPHTEGSSSLWPDKLDGGFLNSIVTNKVIEYCLVLFLNKNQQM